jgi:hypothetical protein
MAACVVDSPLIPQAHFASVIETGKAVNTFVDGHFLTGTSVKRCVLTRGRRDLSAPNRALSPCRTMSSREFRDTASSNRGESNALCTDFLITRSTGRLCPQIIPASNADFDYRIFAKLHEDYPIPRCQLQGGQHYQCVGATLTFMKSQASAGLTVPRRKNKFFGLPRLYLTVEVQNPMPTRFKPEILSGSVKRVRHIDKTDHHHCRDIGKRNQEKQIPKGPEGKETRTRLCFSVPRVYRGLLRDSCEHALHPPHEYSFPVS